ncbi:hypothetical protein CDD80_6174 [Ophiocordyceps camponoti-rufipedis]|uniref:AB hydrolase-1 domain-containing protein n=1 Tax=Ophiocordyceps camponoti-rufipedis TaxID=2004952 RepID=A0A2C5YT34_9HYPO|nr:hypothetical protein CDD80_6174 [Ophiocordyceps camponoti-rufipedis]
MLVLFQNVIIYNPFMPPNARSMRIADFARQCGGIQWREERIRSLDGTEIALCVSEMSPHDVAHTRVYILYFQGNASSLPPRLPDISWVLRRLKDQNKPISYTTVCLSYRGYWTSHDRPSERGINLDAQAALQWVARLHRDSLAKPVVLLWGQSIGCGFATNLAASSDSDTAIDALILETPFTNTRAMLKALYPQKWLPYQHLWPFLRNHLDSWKNLARIAAKQQFHPPAVYLVEAAKDELVPRDHAAALQRRCQDLGLAVTRISIAGALHNDVMVRKSGKQAIAESISEAVTKAVARPGSEPGIDAANEVR